MAVSQTRIGIRPKLKKRWRCLATFLVAGVMLPFVATALDLVSTPGASFSPPVSAGGDSYMPIISADGRYVLFGSTANNLSKKTNGSPYLLPRPEKINVFLRDRVQGTTVLVSADATDSHSGEDDSIPTGISTNGQFALFESASRSFVSSDPSRTNSREIYLRDVINKTTTLVTVRAGSLSTAGVNDSTMTPDARYVAFSSTDTNFVAGNTNHGFGVFVRDLVAGQTRLASGGIPGPISCSSPVITPDGKFVAFQGILLTANPTQDVYVCDLTTTNTFCVSSNSHQVISGVPWCYGQKISQDGKYVAYQANLINFPTTSFVFRHNLQTGTDDIITTNAVPASSSQSIDMSPDGRFIAYIGKTDFGTEVFLWDGQTATTATVSIHSSGPSPPPISCEFPSVDATGRFVTFLGACNFFVTNAVGNLVPHIYRRDTHSFNPVELVDVGTDGNATNRTFNSDYSMSADGRFIAFDSPDTDLVVGDGNNASDVFVRDMVAETTELVSAADASLATQTSGRGDKRSRARVSADGRYAVFIAVGADLVPGYTNRFRGAFVRDLVNQSNFVASVDTNGLGNADGSAAECAISGDGHYVVFTTLADNLVANDANHASDVFLRDLQAETTVLVSTNKTGGGSGSGPSYSPTIGSDGRYVTYVSTATNIVALPAITGTNLFVYDRTLRTNYALTTNSVMSAASTPDGRYVVFGNVNSFGTPILYVWDSQLAQRVFTNSLSSGVISSLAISPNGQSIAYILTSGLSASLKVVDRLSRATTTVSAGSFGLRPNPRFSGDAQSLVYATAASNAPPDFNKSPDVYVFDLVSKTNMLVSRSFSTGNAPAGSSDLPDISADGRYITYQSDALDIVPSNKSSRLKDIFLYDRQSGSTVLLSASIYGAGTGDFVSQSPAFTGDGQTVTFQSWASDLTANDFNQGSDVFLLNILSSSSTNPPPVFTGQIIFSPGSGAGPGQSTPQLTWAAAPGVGYQVQYKTNLTDDAWLPVNGSVVIEGGQGYVQDLSPDPDHRFYRIVAY